MNERALYILPTFPIHSCILTQPHNTTEISFRAPITCHLPIALDIIHFLLELSTVFYMGDNSDLLEIMLVWLLCCSLWPGSAHLWFSFYVLSLGNLITLCGSVYHLHACDCKYVFLCRFQIGIAKCLLDTSTWIFHGRLLFLSIFTTQFTIFPPSLLVLYSQSHLCCHCPSSYLS